MRRARTFERLTRTQITVVLVCLVFIAAVGVVNHDRAHRGSPHSAPTPAHPSAGPTTTALDCSRQLNEPDVGLLTVADVWPGSGGGGDSDTAADLSSCATRSSGAGPAGSTCQLDVFSELSSSGERYLAGLGAAAVRSRQLVHGPLAAVTETVVRFPASAGHGADVLRAMLDRCTPSVARSGFLTTIAESAAARSVIVLDFDDDSLTAALRSTLLVRAAQATRHA